MTDRVPFPAAAGVATDRTLAAAGLILGYAMIIGFTDNFVQLIAVESGLWQFHLTRSVIGVTLLMAVAPFLGLRLRPVRPGAVALRSVLHALAMLIYFGALAFLPVAMVAAGLFTAPIFVLLITRFAFGEPIGPVQMLAVALGFAGVLMVLGPEALSGATLAAVLPILAGAMYALGNVATRAWCAQESAGTLLAGFFVTLGLFGAIGFAVLALVPVEEAAGAAGFLLRGPVWPSGMWYGWTFVQAAGSLIGVGMMIRGYQVTTASKASVLEYMILPASALWGWVLWGQGLSGLAVAGMALIVVAGVLIATRRPAPVGAAA